MGAMKMRIKKMKIKDLEMEYKVKIGAPGTMNLSTYVKKLGFPSFAKCLDTLEKIRQA